jgi:hypothetical protein
LVLGSLVPLASSATNFFTITDSGWVAVGSTTPLSPFDVAGAIYSRLKALSDSSSVSVDWSAGNTQAITLNTSNTTMTFSNAQAGGDYKLLLTQDGTGGRVITWPLGVIWAGGTAPTLSTGGLGKDMVRFTYDGTNYWGEYSLGFAGPSTVAEWNMNGTAGSSGKKADDGPFENNATETGSPTATTAHLSPTTNGAYSFDGSSQHLTTSDTGLPSGNSPWTVEAWVYVTSYNTSPSALISFGTRDNYKTMELDIGGTADGAGKIMWGDYGENHSSSGTIATSTWEYVAVTYDGSTLHYYIDGNDVGSYTPTHTPNLTLNGTSYIGVLNDGSEYYFKGDMDMLRVSNTAKSATAIYDYYQANH